MKSATMRGVLLAAAALCVFAVAAMPAHARVNANTAVSGTSTDSSLTDESTGLRTRCPRADGTGTTNADGRRVSLALTFTGDGRTTCTESLFGSSVTVACRGNVTLTSTASTAGVSASGTISLDTGFECRITSLAGTRTIRGPQSPTNCRFGFTQSTQILTVRCDTIAVDGGGESGFAASYRVTPRLTVS
jgi:hypothetical protein